MRPIVLALFGLILSCGGESYELAGSYRLVFAVELDGGGDPSFDYLTEFVLVVGEDRSLGFVSDFLPADCVIEDSVMNEVGELVWACRSQDGGEVTSRLRLIGKVTDGTVSGTFTYFYADFPAPYQAVGRFLSR